MTAALAAAGLRAADAFAAVLLYRIVAFKIGITLAWFAERTVTRHRSRTSGVIAAAGPPGRCG